MELFVVATSRLRLCEKRFIADHLTLPDSEFQRKLLLGEPVGTIAICLDHGEIVGWARTEPWNSMPTLEAFTASSYRRRGIATLCAAGLVAEGVYDDAPVVAVFRESMAQLAESLVIVAKQFARQPDGTWEPA